MRNNTFSQQRWLNIVYINSYMKVNFITTKVTATLLSTAAYKIMTKMRDLGSYFKSYNVQTANLLLKQSHYPTERFLGYMNLIVLLTIFRYVIVKINQVENNLCWEIKLAYSLSSKITSDIFPVWNFLSSTIKLL